jgi:acetyl esterase
MSRSDNESAEELPVVLVVSVKSPICSGEESVVSYAVLLRVSCRGSGNNGDAGFCPIKRDNGPYHEVVLYDVVPAFEHFTRAPEQSASMNQLIEQPPKTGLEARVDPGVGSFLRAQARRGWPAADDLSVEEARGMLLQTQAGYILKSRVDVEDRTILVGPRGNTAIRIVRPRGSTAALPAVIYFHGGGWVLGDEETHDHLIREISLGANAAVVFVKYTRSPEARYPVAIEEGYAVTKWIFETGKMINVDPSRIAVAGDGSGGNIAAAVTMLAKERGGPELRFQVLFYPVTDASFDTQSYDTFASGYLLTRDAMKWFWNHYAQNTATRDRPTASPLRASLDELRNLPAALIITAECDILRDEGEAYAAKLKQADVPVIATRYPGMIHDFVMYNALSETTGARQAINEANESLRAAFLPHS